MEDYAVFMQRTRFYPTLGKEADVRAQLTGWAKSLQAKGRRVALTQRLFSSEGPILVISGMHDNLANLDKLRRANLADPDWRATADKVLSLCRDSMRITLAESVIPHGVSSAPTVIVQRAYFRPAPGKEGQVRQILEEFVHAAHSGGRPQTSLWQRVFSSDGAVFEVVAMYTDLAELERVRRERMAIAQTTVAAIHEVSRAPIAIRLFEVVLPFPSQPRVASLCRS